MIVGIGTVLAVVLAVVAGAGALVTSVRDDNST